MFVSGVVAPEDEREEAFQLLARERQAPEAAHVRGDRPACARWFPGCPARASLGGIGGNRWWVMAPEPISWDMRLSTSGNRRNAKRVSVAKVDRLKSQLASLPQRPKQPSAGGSMVAFASKSGAKLDLPPLWSPRTMRVHGVAPSVNGSNDDEYSQILRLRPMAPP